MTVDSAARTASLLRLHSRPRARTTPATRPSSASTRRPALLRHRAGNPRTRDIRLLHLEGTSCLGSWEWLETRLVRSRRKKRKKNPTQILLPRPTFCDSEFGSSREGNGKSDHCLASACFTRCICNRKRIFSSTPCFLPFYPTLPFLVFLSVHRLSSIVFRCFRLGLALLRRTPLPVPLFYSS
jgi:hypothetical protein